jgi:alpha-glucoside transport system permease protein
MQDTQHSGRASSFIEGLLAAPVRLLAALIIPAITLVLLYQSFIFLRDSEANKLTIVLVALLVGIGGVWALYYSTDLMVDTLFSDRWKALIRPFVFVGPAVAVLVFFLVYPVFRSTYLSFFNRTSENFIGFDNYIFALTDPAMLQAARNSVLWMVVVTAFSLIFGLIVAVLADQVRFESVVKSLIFLPMAISFVGASVIWRFVYAFVPAGRDQIGLLNAIWVWLGGEPIGWLIQQPWNNFMLMIVLIWLQTGFSMVLISAAIKSVPEDIKQAARIDGANEIQVFFRIVIPTIRPTLVTVATTVLILTLKVFDIVWVMTNGNFGTEVVASRMIKEIARFRDFGRGSAIAVILLLATIPVMVYNIRSFRETEQTR